MKNVSAALNQYEKRSMAAGVAARRHGGNKANMKISEAIISGESQWRRNGGHGSAKLNRKLKAAGESQLAVASGEIRRSYERHEIASKKAAIKREMKAAGG